MARMEGNNQPDLLNILRKHGNEPVPPPPPLPAPSSGASVRRMPVLSPEEPVRSGRGPERRDAFLLCGLALIVAGLAAAVIYSRWNRASGVPVTQPRPSSPRPAVPASSPAGTLPAKPPVPAAALPDAVRVVTRAAPGTGKSFYTLALVTYGGTKEAEARETCAWLKAKDRRFSDLFLYKTTNSKTRTQQYTICLGHYDRNPLSLDKANALHAEVQRMPNASGRREFEECQFLKLETSEP